MATDSSLYTATQISATGTYILSLKYGTQSVRTGYGNPTLRSIQTFYNKTVETDDVQVKIEIINSNWTTPIYQKAGQWGNPAAMAINSYNNTPGHNAPLNINSTFLITATVTGTLTGTIDICSLLDIDYSAVASVDPNAAGYPVSIGIVSESVTTQAMGVTDLGSFDVLKPNVRYQFQEMFIDNNTDYGMSFIIIQGIVTQSGLIRIVPITSNATGLVKTLFGSVLIEKQSVRYTIFTEKAVTGTVPVMVEYLADRNSI